MWPGRMNGLDINTNREARSVHDSFRRSGVGVETKKHGANHPGPGWKELTEVTKAGRGTNSCVAGSHSTTERRGCNSPSRTGRWRPSKAMSRAGSLSRHTFSDSAVTRQDRDRVRRLAMSRFGSCHAHSQPYPHHAESLHRKTVSENQDHCCSQMVAVAVATGH